jgi:hypothetical protein
MRYIVLADVGGGGGGEGGALEVCRRRHPEGADNNAVTHLHHHLHMLSVGLLFQLLQLLLDLHLRTWQVQKKGGQPEEGEGRELVVLFVLAAAHLQEVATTVEERIREKLWAIMWRPWAQPRHNRIQPC